MTYNPAIHHRRSIRLKGYDYASPGAYFITICTQHREYFFGDIHHGAMILTPYGEIAKTQWYAIGARFPNVTAGEYVTMPNHVHGIIYIHPPVQAPLAGAPIGGVPLPNAGEKPYTPNDTGKPHVSGTSGCGTGAPARGAPTIAWTTFAPSPATGRAGDTKTLGYMVGAYKSLVVHGCLQWIKQTDPRIRLGTAPGRALWQRNYWEHIVRDEMELNRIREYIRNNPTRWEEDRFYGRETGDQIRRACAREEAARYGEEDWMM